MSKFLFHPLHICNSFRLVTHFQSLYRLKGNDQYMIGEPITQMMHAKQTMHIAMQWCENQKKIQKKQTPFLFTRREEAALVIAAAIHDIGHFIEKKPKYKNHFQIKLKPLNPKTDQKDDQHEYIGAQYLRFNVTIDPMVTELISMHVNAKRALCFQDQYYYMKLSEASRQSMVLQGDSMKATEYHDFIKHPLSQMALLLRSFDDQAKQHDFDPLFPNKEINDYIYQFHFQQNEFVNDDAAWMFHLIPFLNVFDAD